ncbi:HPP family protein [Aquabacterium sp.]|uniref:HPP family protein n=1 Tax=Aquabacterium sp. TaxID=1872578 RepID=UPI0037848BE4
MREAWLSGPAGRHPRWRTRLQALWPARMPIDGRERLRVVAGVGMGLLITGMLCHALAGPGGLPWLVAPLGASAVLVFGVPASPLAQPWSVLGGNTLSALVGIACVHWLPAPVLAAAVATALAVALMLALRCLHPPGGAAALLTVLGAVGDWHFAFFPVALNSLLLVAAGIAYNQATGRRYPHVNREAPPGPAATARFSDADLDAVLKRYNQVLDVPRDDLQRLLEQAEVQSHARRLAELHCRDIMTPDPITVEFGSPLQEAWTLLREHRIKALPVIDRQRRIVGILTLADFLRAAELDVHEGFDAKLRRLIRATPGVRSDKPEAVGQIMTRQVRVASAERSLAELVPIFSSTGHHHIPIIDGGGRLVGIVTQTDLVSALLRMSG